MNFNRDIRPRYRTPQNHPQPMPQPLPAQPTHHQQPANHQSQPTPQHNQHHKAKKVRFWQGRKWWVPALIVVMVLIVGLLAYGYISTKNELSKAKNNIASANPETTEVLTEVGKLIQLPQNDKPTIATIKDASKLKNQEFFANAENGDKVIIFAKSNRAVLYRPSTNKIIEYSKVNFDSSQ